MNRRTKSSLLAVVALFAIPALSACIIQPSGGENDNPDDDTVETDDQSQNGDDQNNNDQNNDDHNNDDQSGGDEARFDGPEDFYAQIGSGMQECSQTAESPLPEDVESLEPMLAGAVYAFCTFDSGDQLIGILMPDTDGNMVDTSIADPGEIQAFKDSADVSSIAMGGNWLVTSQSDALVTEFASAFGGEVH
ncbi:MAG TPA: hypothetical protein H9830_15560 [Candidatus Agrococcus pullicola]|uniref:Secreted protein n=1 Tax=Candidatus Agrococcus pullicola TaxID=2838429 RepID=A0A9D2CAV1_9MICO|nr:hypothetical protein [Candidatus Agrococcus pullicola]